MECHDKAAAEHAVAADRFAHEIGAILKARCGALAAAERQPVGRRRIKHLFQNKLLVCYTLDALRRRLSRFVDASPAGTLLMYTDQPGANRSIVCSQA
jgi:hypothetical protein